MANQKRRIPVSVIEFDNSKSKLSKKDIEARRRCEIHLGNDVIEEPADVASDSYAHEKWLWLMDLFEGFQFVSSADRDVFGQYCLAWSQWRHLQAARRNLMKKLKGQRKASYEIMEELYKQKIPQGIDKQNEVLMRLGPKLFLDPASRIKAIPLPKKGEEKPADPLSKFGTV